MTPLHRRLVDLIRRDGPIGVEDYMRLCLADPEHGYYMKRDPLGRGGDFTTSPEISQMFGELVGIWIASAWRAMGKSDIVNIVELGPGRGTMIGDALRAMRAAPGLPEATRLFLIDNSPTMRGRQRATLAKAPPLAHPPQWLDDFAGVPDGPLILVANEFFDALPIKQLVKTSDGWRERRVACDDDGNLTFIADGPGDDRLDEDAPENALKEISPVSLGVIDAIATRIAPHGGAALIIDYGPSQSGYGDTLQAMRNHRFDEPLASPGEADLTAHVDFAALLKAARRDGVATQGPTTQADFLEAMEIDMRAASLRRHATPEQQNDIATALARLTDRRSATGMGVLFKAIALRQASLPPMPGFPDSTSSP